MKLIAHRKNTIADLLASDPSFGVEVDIRSNGERLTIHHDPFMEGVSFDEWLSVYHHGTLILNVKEEGLEERLISKMEEKGIEDYFFLDQSFPFLVKWAKRGLRKSAVRVSEFETVETALSLRGLIDWVWVDCFTRFPLGRDDAARLKEAGFKLCIVSPELQGRTGENEIPEMIVLLNERRITADAVCTKQPLRWQRETAAK